jgi:hypothetical protein
MGGPQPIRRRLPCNICRHPQSLARKRRPMYLSTVQEQAGGGTPRHARLTAALPGNRRGQSRNIPTARARLLWPVQRFTRRTRARPTHVPASTGRAPVRCGVLLAGPRETARVHFWPLNPSAQASAKCIHAHPEALRDRHLKSRASSGRR